MAKFKKEEKTASEEKKPHYGTVFVAGALAAMTIKRAWFNAAENRRLRRMVNECQENHE